MYSVRYVFLVYCMYSFISSFRDFPLCLLFLSICSSVFFMYLFISFGVSSLFLSLVICLGRSFSLALFHSFFR